MKKLLLFACIACANLLPAGTQVGLVCKIDKENKSFNFLAETAYDPKKPEGNRSFTFKWNDKTRIITRQMLSDISQIPIDSIASFKLTQEQLDAFEAGKSFSISILLLENYLKDVPLRKQHSSNFYAKVNPIKGKKNAFAVENNGTVIAVKAPKAQLLLSGTGEDLHENLSIARVSYDDKTNMASSITIQQQLPDPAKIDDPSLPRVLVIGDSISMNYDIPTRNLLKGKANYYRIFGNSGRTSRGVSSLDMWLGDMSLPGMQWDVICVNHGLHDLLIPTKDDKWGEKNAIDIPEYKSNLKYIFARLSKLAKTKVIWITTTPVPNDSLSPKYGGRKKDAELPYNEAAAEVLKEFPAIQVCDLNKFVRNSSAFDTWRQGNNVHFKPDECKELATEVSAIILKALEK